MLHLWRLRSFDGASLPCFKYHYFDHKEGAGGPGRRGASHDFGREQAWYQWFAGLNYSHREQMLRMPSNGGDPNTETHSLPLEPSLRAGEWELAMHTSLKRRLFANLHRSSRQVRLESQHQHLQQTCPLCQSWRQESQPRRPKVPRPMARRQTLIVIP